MKKSIPALLALLAISPLTAAPAPTKLEVTCNDQMTYNTRRLEVPAGSKVTLTLKNVGKIPLKQMAHNLVIVKPGTSLPVFSGRAAADPSDYLPNEPEMKKLIVAHTKRLGGGDSDTITFTLTEPGDYPFLCTTPGHFAEMNGILTVKAAE